MTPISNAAAEFHSVPGDSRAGRPTAAVICDFGEEQWISMDLAADMILQRLGPAADLPVIAERIRPVMRRRLSSVPFAAHTSFNIDRLIGRFYDYPRALRRASRSFDIYHIVDHSYAHLACELPGDRTVVTCHDLDALRPLHVRSFGIRAAVLRGMANRIVKGLRHAARIVCVSRATRDELRATGLVDDSRVLVAYNGVNPACSPDTDAEADAIAAQLCGMNPESVPILHVGSTIARKRIDVLLEVAAAVRAMRPSITLLRVGGPFTAAQQAQVDRLSLSGSIRVLPRVSARVLSAIYRRVAAVLQPSEREGFGLPVAEAMACGSPVIASDIPSLREIGGEAAVYCPVGDVPAWTAEVTRLIDEYTTSGEPSKQRRCTALAQASAFTWASHGEQLATIYLDVISKQKRTWRRYELNGKPH